jgi:heme/copper-type cytochrome/quinol oxidase subunit 2
MTIKVIGHQWYWSYERNTYNHSYEFDSFMVNEEDMHIGKLRLLEVDNPLYVPAVRRIRFLVTSADVLHCWAIPGLAIKIDGVPGRLNQFSTVIIWTGKFHGQCSEICGVHHGFMPIVVIAEIFDFFYHS